MAMEVPVAEERSWEFISRRGKRIVDWSSKLRDGELVPAKKAEWWRMELLAAGLATSWLTKSLASPRPDVAAIVASDVADVTALAVLGAEGCINVLRCGRLVVPWMLGVQPGLNLHKP